MISTSKTLKFLLVAPLPLNTADVAPWKDALWKRLVSISLDPKVIYLIESVYSTAFEWYKNHQNRTCKTYLKIIRLCFIALSESEMSRSNFYYILCLISSFSNIPVKSSVSCGDLDFISTFTCNGRGWTPGMAPRNDSLPQPKKFRDDIGIRW